MLTSVFRIYLVTFLIFAATACELTRVDPSYRRVQNIPEREYRSILKRFQSSKKRYDGFHQTFEAHAVLINTPVHNAILQRQAHFKGWSPSEFNKFRQEASQKRFRTTDVYLSYYAPNVRHDKLHRDTSIWNFYLEAGGERYPGKVRLDKSTLVEQKSLFYFADRFKTGYYVSFDVPVSVIETKPSQVLMSSSLGEATFIFAAAALPTDENFQTAE